MYLLSLLFYFHLCFYRSTYYSLFLLRGYLVFAQICHDLYRLLLYFLRILYILLLSNYICNRVFFQILVKNNLNLNFTSVSLQMFIRRLCKIPVFFTSNCYVVFHSTENYFIVTVLVIVYIIKSFYYIVIFHFAYFSKGTIFF